MFKYVISLLLILSINFSTWGQIPTKMPHPEPSSSWMEGDTVFLSDKSVAQLKAASGVQASKGLWKGNPIVGAVDYVGGLIDYFLSGTLEVKVTGHCLICLDGQIYGFEDHFKIHLPHGSFTYFLAFDNFSNWKGPFHASVDIWNTTVKVH